MSIRFHTSKAGSGCRCPGRPCGFYLPTAWKAIVRAILLGLTLLPALVWSHAMSDIIEVMASAGLTPDAPQTFSSHGVLMSVTGIQAAEPPAQVAEKLSKSGRFEQLLTLPGELWLSGLSDKRHWLAILRARGEGTHGQLSVMLASPRAATAMPVWPGLGFIERHAPVKRVFSHASDSASDAVQQHAWLVGWRPERLFRFVQTQVQQRGGHILSQSKGKAGWAAVWLLDHHELDMRVVPHRSQTLLFIQVAGPGSGSPG